MRTKIEEMGLDLYNALRGPLSQMESADEMDKFEINLSGYSKDIIVECMKCARINIGSGENMKRAGVKMNFAMIDYYNNLIIEACESAINKEDNKMKITGLENAEKIFQYEGAVYTQTKTNYFFKTTGGRGKNGQALKMRIPKHAFEAAYENYLQGKKDAADAEDTKNEIREEDAWDVKNDPKAEEKKAPKKTKKARKSKDIAHESNGVTLTAKQVEFLKLLPTVSFWENGLDSALWCDCIADDIGWNPMSVGAMVSTLREKNLVFVTPQKVNGKKCKGMEFTELGKEIAKELGLA